MKKILLTIAGVFLTPLVLWAQEAYTVYDSENTTLTFYYDDQREVRSGTIFKLDDSYGRQYPNNARKATKVVFDASFASAPITNCHTMFSNFTKLLEIEGMKNLNTSEVTNMYGMFSFCSSLESVDLSHFDTRKVTKMGEMFLYSSAFKSLDLSSFNPENVTNMGRMFESCRALESIKFGVFDARQVTSMQDMFYNCKALTTIDLSGVITSQLTDMDRMFGDCRSLESIKFSENFNTSQVTSMRSVFSSCVALTSLDLSYFNTNQVTNVQSMVSSCKSLESIKFSENLNWSQVTNMAGMFVGCSSLKSLDLSSFSTSQVTDMSSMFSGCYALSVLDLRNFDVSNLTNMQYMFQDCSNLTTIYCNNNWKTESQGVNAYNMFWRSSLLKGAVAYNSKNPGMDFANPDTGYFTYLYEISDDMIDDIADVVYNTKPQEPPLTVKHEEMPALFADYASTKTLAAGTHYTAVYTENIDAGTATVTITGRTTADAEPANEATVGNYEGTASKTFIILKAPITPVVTIEDWTYTETAKIPVVTGNPGNGKVTYYYKVKEADDETYTNIVPVNAGNYTIKAVVAETKNYLSGEATTDFTIARKPVTSLMIQSVESPIYTGLALTPEITVKDGTTILTLTEEYTVSYADNINAGTATVTITGQGNYTDTASGSFTILKAPINPTVAITGWTYGEETNAPTLTGNTDNGEATYYYKGKKADDNTYKTDVPTKAGKYTVKVVVEATDNYQGGENTADFVISPKELTADMVADIDNVLETGEPTTPALTVMDGDVQLVVNKDFTVAYTDNINSGTATATVTGKGNYTGSVVKTYTIIRGTKGDANCDETVNAADIVEVVNAINGNPSPNYNAINADVDSDGNVTQSDVDAIANMIIGKN